MIFCKKCQATGKPKVLPPGKTVKGNTEVCPNCGNAQHVEYYVDEAAAHHAQAHFKSQMASKN
jgi:DNA-directed RNA polymerase subunit M/transcription elongation factor TFIIS